MTAAPKRKGPEALERLPSRAQSEPDKGSKMNAHTHITQLVPYPSQTPFNEYDQAMIRLRIVGKLIESRKTLDLEEINDVMTLLYCAMDTLEPVGSYLDEIEYEEGHQQRFIECRRRWLIERTQGAAS